MNLRRLTAVSITILIAFALLCWQGYDLVAFLGEGFPGISAPDTPGHWTPSSALQYWAGQPSEQAYISIVLIVTTLAIATFWPRQRRLAMGLALLVVVRHFYWRAFHTLDFENPVSASIGILLFVAEIYGMISISLSFYQMYQPVSRITPAKMTTPDPASLPSVDILIPSYSEPLEVLYRTLVGALAIDYPHKTVWLLDDGKRPDVQLLCLELGCQYLTRQDNTHAKAGNLNAAFAKLSGELVVVFDADHVPVQSFLEKTVPYFSDPKLGFVQTPQHFATLDPFQRNLVMQRDLANEQDLFYHVILPGMDALGAVTFAGSGTVFRRSALDAIHGFATETVTEDIHTGMRLHKQGWKSIYVNEDLSAGLAPETFGDFLNQRLRWGRGATQVFVIENPFLQKGLSLAQKLSYFNALWYFLQGFPRLMFLIAPMIYLLFGIVTIHAAFYEVLTYYLCYFLVSSITYTQISGRVRQAQWSEVYETAFCFYLSLVTLFSFFNPHKAHFKVTPKGQKTDRLSFEWAAVAPQLVLFALTLIGLGGGISQSYLHPENTGIILWNGFWAGYNGLLLICAILVAFNRPQRRAHPRVSRSIPAEVALQQSPENTIHALILDLGEGGAKLVAERPLPVRCPLAIHVVDPVLKLQTKLCANVVRSHLDTNGQHLISVSFDHSLLDIESSQTARKNIVLHTFTAPDVWVNYHHTLDPLTSLRKLILSPLRWLLAKEKPGRRLAPRFYTSLGCHLESPDPTGKADKRLAGKIIELSETGATLQIPMPQLLKPHALAPIPLQQFTLRFTCPSNELGLALLEINALIVKRLKKRQLGYEEFGIVFPLSTEPGQQAALNAIRAYLYQPKLLVSQVLDISAQLIGEAYRPDQIETYWHTQANLSWQTALGMDLDETLQIKLPFGLDAQRIQSDSPS